MRRAEVKEDRLQSVITPHAVSGTMGGIMAHILVQGNVESSIIERKSLPEVTNEMVDVLLTNDATITITQDECVGFCHHFFCTTP